MQPVPDADITIADVLVRESVGNLASARDRAVWLARRALCTSRWDDAESYGNAAAVIAYRQNVAAGREGVLL